MIQSRRRARTGTYFVFPGLYLQSHNAPVIPGLVNAVYRIYMTNPKQAAPREWRPPLARGVRASCLVHSQAIHMATDVSISARSTVSPMSYIS